MLEREMVCSGEGMQADISGVKQKRKLKFSI